MRRTMTAMTLTLGLVAAAQAANTGQGTGHGAGHGHASPYAGQQDRAVKSLSDDDLAELRRGGGWGLAKAAELNGMPGPAHLLEMKAEIGMSADQVAAVEAVFAGMKSDAVRLGGRLIDAERKLEDLFRGGAITDAQLKAALAEIAEARRELRYTHLAAHLKTPGILSKAQIAAYNRLRGYAAADPCTDVPAGHDPAMWHRHNGCK
ncbi:MAG: hypothetical protein VW405_05570 [Rhodospirillaceae bacterium]